MPVIIIQIPAGAVAFIKVVDLVVAGTVATPRLVDTAADLETGIATLAGMDKDVSSQPLPMDHP